MSIEQVLEKLTAALEANTAALQGSVPPTTATATAADETPGVKSRRARTPKSEAAAPAVSQAALTPATETIQSAAPAPDPFAEVTINAPPITKEDVRNAAVELSKATTQDNAVAVIKAATGLSYPELKSEHYGPAWQALKAALGAALTPSPVADPFAAGSTPASPQQVDAPSLDDVKAAIRKARQRTGDNLVQKIVIDNGGVAVNPSDGQRGISMNALPISAYAAVIAAVNALPDTKTGK